MLKIASVLLFLVGALGLLGGEWLVPFKEITQFWLTLVEWLILLASLVSLVISFTVKRIGRKWSWWGALFCALSFLIQFTWCGLFGFTCAIVASVLIILAPDQNFSKESNLDIFMD